MSTLENLKTYERVLAVYPDDLPSQASLALGAPGK